MAGFIVTNCITGSQWDGLRAGHACACQTDVQMFKSFFVLVYMEQRHSETDGIVYNNHSL